MVDRGEPAVERVSHRRAAGMRSARMAGVGGADWRLIGIQPLETDHGPVRLAQVVASSTTCDPVAGRPHGSHQREPHA